MTRNGTIKNKVIGYPYVPWIIIIFSAILVINTLIIEPKASLLGILLVLSGVPFYYYFKKNMTSSV